MKPDEQPDTRLLGGVRERGQLVLISAILIAFIILGLVVVFNGILYTETVATGDASEEMDDLAMAEMELTQTVESILAKGGDASTIENASKSHLERSAHERGAVVTIYTVSGTDPVEITYGYKSDSINANRTLEIDP